MALIPRLVSGSSAKRPEPSGINAMLRVQQNSTGQPWIAAELDAARALGLFPPSPVQVRIGSRSNPTRLPSTISIHRATRCRGLSNDAQRRRDGSALPDRRKCAVAIVNAIHG